MNREQSIHQYASTLGFDRCGIARCRPLEERRDQLQQWLDQGHHGGLTYMERNLDKRLDPTLLVEGARSIIVCAISYKRPPAQGLITRFASYAWGRDYHSVLKEKLRALFAHIQELIPNTTGRLFVDTAPILEKSWAAEAGVGRIGRNSLLIVPGIGSFVVLGLIVTNAELEPDTPPLTDRSLRELSGLRGGLPGRGHRPQPHHRCLPLHRSPHHRSRARQRRGAAWMDFWVRHLPTGLSAQPPRPCVATHLLCSYSRVGRDDCKRLATVNR